MKNRIDAFTVFNTIILLILAIICLVPIIHIAAVSFSSSASAATGTVSLWPKDFSLNSYNFVSKRPAFWLSFNNSLIRVLAGSVLNVFLTILTAYPLSKDKRRFAGRTIYAWLFFFTMIFSGGFIPWYMTIHTLGLLDNILALILPGAVPVFSVLVLLNFFRNVPYDLTEAALIDGAGEWRILFQIYVPLSIPAIVTILLFAIVHHWNSWFDGLILMNNPDNYPLQSYLQTIVVQRNFSQMTREEIQQLSTISDKTLRSAQIFLGSLPVIAIYPFLQRFFITGIALGGVKG